MKFIHTADIHLGHPFTGLNNLPNELLRKIETATFNSFIKLVDYAIKYQVDFILISGDLFDTKHQNIEVLDFLKNQFKRLSLENIDVYLSFGNHDFNQTIANFNFGDNVTLFSKNVTVKETVTSDNKNVKIVGFSYQQQHINKNIIDQFPIKTDSDFEIGMYHGSVDGKNGQYAPFNVTQMKEKHYDYWALGHIHKRQVLSQKPFIAYSGNLQGQNIKEIGEKGFYLVTSNGNELKPKFISCAEVIWQIVKFDIPTVATQNDLLKLIISKLKDEVDKNVSLKMIRLELVGSFEFPQLLQIRLLDGSTLAQINQELKTLGINNLWINDVNIEQKNSRQKLPGIDEKIWEAAAKNVFSAQNIHVTGLKNIPDTFVTNYFDQKEVQSQLKKYAQLQLELQMNGDFLDED